ncbi:NAD(P)/FAD-dependent oxidoreductase [Echinicola vietnamensis]|uniref:Thioredoxin reductase n=1 Tax=Echinicola vietnamensis (strain DSM 17526 / LMG 23754 / KMM 6221) TaxID=926556 RepID=L0G1G0_ECHVK|nr:NAD(P)/FAD-dependent oxidoreductase [Echinicola vietnamensis]AGA80019.1 thioredoxin reductase [Echinicola vietnamensis DSM 17526]
MYDVIIIGGSYAGLSAALSLGRALRSVLILDSGHPCNKQTPHSHNFLTQDGKRPSEIAEIGLNQVLNYPTVTFRREEVIDADKTEAGFNVISNTGAHYASKKLLFSTGVADQMPAIEGFADCWGISIIHCPYCHGYEVKGQPTAIMANGEKAFHMGKLLQNWTSEITLLTNGPSTLTSEQHASLEEDGIPVLSHEIIRFQHKNGQLENIHFSNGSSITFPVMYAAIPFKQHTDLPHKLGCEVNEGGHLIVNEKQQTTVSGIYAAGDNSTPLRAVSIAVAGGTMAGAMINFDLIMG